MKPINLRDGRGRCSREILLAAAASACLMSSMSMAAEITSPVVNLAVPNTVAGVYINVVNGATGTSQGAVSGWDLNPYSMVSGSSLGIYWGLVPSLADRGGGVAATTTGPLLPLAPGDTIGPAATYSAAISATNPNFRVTQTGYIGFRFHNENTGMLNYGYMQISTTAATGFPATIHSIVYEDTGAAITIPSLTNADLAVAVTSNSSAVRVGQTASFGVGVSNNGPDASGATSLALTLDAEIAGASAAAPAGWTCGAAVVGVGETTIDCDATDMAASTSAMFTVNAPMGNAQGSTTVSLLAVVDGTATDATPANDFDSASVNVTSSANLRLTLTGPSQPVRSGTRVPFFARVDNYGSDAAAYPVVTVSGNLAVDAFSATPPSGWSCVSTSELPKSASPQTSLPTAEIRCTYNGFFNRGAVVIPLSVWAPSSAAGGYVTINGTVASTTSDPIPSNNGSTYKLNVKATPTLSPVAPPLW